MRKDEMLMARAAAGDGHAFAELVAPHRAELLRFARRMLREDGQAGEEVFQEAMLNAYCALGHGTRPKSVRPWLFQIVRNGALNARRRAQPTCALADGDGQAVQRTPNDAAEQGEWMDWLMGAIAGLPSRQRHALVGRELEGRSHAELAASLGTSVLAVKTLLHRARGTLRRLRAESMLSVPMLVKGRLAGAKVGAGVIGQAMFAASLTSLIVLAVHTGGVGSVHAAGLPAGGARATVPRHGPRSVGPAFTRLSRKQVESEGQQAITRCDHGLSVRDTSPQALTYAIGQLSAAELEYTNCQQVLQSAALMSLKAPPARVYFARSSGGLLIGATCHDPLVIKPSSIAIFPHRDWSITGLHWTGWGGGTTRATGTSVEAQCEPGCTTGSPAGLSVAFFRSSSASIVLSSPGPFDGHKVYRCFFVRASSSVPSAVGGCSGRGRLPQRLAGNR
jgi:RNA polymerase sigma-70 factor (ECF subfamily)